MHGSLSGAGNFSWRLYAGLDGAGSFRIGCTHLGSSQPHRKSVPAGLHCNGDRLILSGLRRNCFAVPDKRAEPAGKCAGKVGKRAGKCAGK